MDELPSFRRRADVLLLALALLTPWVLVGLAYTGSFVGGILYRSGFQPALLRPAVLIWFYGVSFPALVSLPAWFLFGVWRLVWRPAYRWSWFGWLWPFLMWVDLCLIGSFVGH